MLKKKQIKKLTPQNQIQGLYFYHLTLLFYT